MKKVLLRQPVVFPDNFLFGVATGPAQVEGDLPYGDWQHWLEPPANRQVSGKLLLGGEVLNPVQIGTRSWEDPEKDLEVLKELGVQVYRFGVDWSRIMPNRGIIDRDALNRYRSFCRRLIQEGIRPLVTLHHFSNPQWATESRGFLNSKNLAAWLVFVEEVVKELMAEGVKDWVTINEPNIYAMNSTMLGLWPYHKKSVGNLWEFRRLSKALVKAHSRAYTVIKSLDSQASVGVSHHLRAVHHGGGVIDKISADLWRWLLQGYFLSRMEKFSDFTGVNYYTRDYVDFGLNPFKLTRKFLPARFSFDAEEKNYMGWEIYPRGLAEVILKNNLGKEKPVLITENGIADPQDSKRAGFLYSHLQEVHRLLKFGIKISGYIHWTAWDNMEWVFGFLPAFGLYTSEFEVDNRTGEVTCRHQSRQSGRFFGAICRSRAITPEDMDRYLPRKITVE